MAAAAAITALCNGPNRNAEAVLDQLFEQGANEVLRQVLPQVAEGNGLAAIFLRSKATQALNAGITNHPFTPEVVGHVKAISDSRPQSQLIHQLLSVLLNLHIKVNNNIPVTILSNPNLQSASHFVEVLMDNYEITRLRDDVRDYLGAAAQAVTSIDVRGKPDGNTIAALSIAGRLLKVDALQQSLAFWIFSASKSEVWLSDSTITAEILSAMGHLLRTGSCGNSIPQDHANRLCKIAMDEHNLSFLKEFGSFFGFSTDMIQTYITETMQKETPDVTLGSATYEVIKIAIKYSSFLETLDDGEASYVAELCMGYPPIAVSVIQGLYKRTGSAVDELFSNPLQNPISAIGTNLSGPLRSSSILSLDILFDVLNTEVSDNVGGCYVQFLSKLLIGLSNITAPSIPELVLWSASAAKILAAELTTDELGKVAEISLPKLIESLGRCLEVHEYRCFTGRVLSALSVCCERGTRSECQSLSEVMTRLLSQFSDPKLVAPALECAASVVVGSFEFSVLTKEGFHDGGLRQVANLSASRSLQQSGDVAAAALKYYSSVMMVDIIGIENELPRAFKAALSILEDTDPVGIHTGSRQVELAALNFLSSFLSSASPEQFSHVAVSVVEVILVLSRHAYGKVATAALRSVERLLRIHTNQSSPWLPHCVDMLDYSLSSCLNMKEVDQLASAACNCVEVLSTDNLVPESALVRLRALKKEVEQQQYL
eukprot:TRINITY_DN21090_c0_g1_i1.p1 TRINITY_DN21090_c0_g1~~TRINITY_DN21090_c0_g1_i1.p1  ORF type:complete len:715 (+),score=121.03 TRINITY_DN21090_c0_g1_i1:35-2179(+)